MTQLESEPTHGYARPFVPTSTFGQNLRALMAERTLKPRDLLPQIGVKQGTLSDWMRDRRGLPEGPTLLKFAKALRVTVNDLLAGVDDAHDQLCRDLHPSSEPSIGGSDVTASARILELERRVAAYETALDSLTDVAKRINEVIAVREKGGSARTRTSGRGGSHRKAV